MNLEEAKAYTGVPAFWGLSGEAQLKFLKGEGLLPEHNLLEVGCGSLNAAIPLIRFLNKYKYFGIEPVSELVNAAWHLVEKEKHPYVLDTSHFNIASGFQFDYVISHSVFSHAPDWQVVQCLHNLRSSLSKGCKMYFSLRLAEECSHDVEWRDHPGNTFYTFDWIKDVATKLGYQVTLRDDLKEFFMKKVPPDTHDWIQFIKK